MTSISSEEREVEIEGIQAVVLSLFLTGINIELSSARMFISGELNDAHLPSSSNETTFHNSEGATDAIITRDQIEGRIILVRSSSLEVVDNKVVYSV